MNPLMMLLGQQAGSGLTEPLVDEILVQSNKGGRTQGSPVDGYSAPNDRAIVNVEADVKKGEEASNRRGMFGVKGTLRDILGIVGDAFLVQGGANPVYRPQRDKEKLANAMAGFTEDQLSAAERAAYYDPEAGRQLFDDYQTNLIKQAQTDSLQASRQATIDGANARRIGSGRAVVQNLLAREGAYGADGNLTPDALNVIGLVARQYNTTPEELMGNLNGRSAQLFGESAINPYQQETLEDRDRAGDQRDYSNQTARISATQPRATPRPRSEMDSERFIRIGDKKPSERTVGEQEWYNKQKGSGSILENFRAQQGASQPRFRPAGKK